jgi:hypothetical protein
MSNLGRDSRSALRYGCLAFIITMKRDAAMAEGDQEKRREAALKGAAKRSREERSEASRKAAAAKSPEQRRQVALKAAATRKRNREAKTSVGGAPGL